MSDEILVFGSNGQLGFEICAQSGAFGIDRATCDVLDHGSLRTILHARRPRVVFNCTAYNAVDKAEEEVDHAVALNGVLPGVMARYCKEVGARFVHFSTDYVFGDGHKRPIDESHQPEPLSAYARSKWMGEQAVMHNHPDSLIIRTTGLYSDRRHNFVHTMLKLGRERGELTVVADQHIAPTWVRPLARVSLKLIERDFGGVVHAVNHGGVTWHGFAQKIFDLSNMQVKVHATTQEEWGAAARRPYYSVLDNAVLRTLGIDEFEPWDFALEQFLKPVL
ncbi:MAG: dTDP-4-dehydrorhamnose reductase [bacterium]